MKQTLKKLKILLWCSYFFIFLYAIITINIPIKQIQKENSTISGTIIKIKETEYGLSLILKKNHSKYLVYLKKQDIHLGDKVRITGTLKTPEKNRNFYLFNYQNYLKSQNISYILEGETFLLQEKNKNPIFRIRKNLENYLNSFQDHQYMKLFIMGENTLESDIYNTYKQIGIAHLLAISGMHISLFVSILKRICKKKKIIISLFLLFYFMIAKTTPSLIRAIMVEELALYFPKIERKKCIRFLFFLLILINPYYLFHIGFCLSFSISYFLSHIKIKGNFIQKLFFTSYYAFLIGAPILIDQNFYLNFFQILANLFFVPFVSILLFPLILVTFIIKPLEFFLHPLILLFEYSSKILAKITIFTITVPYLNIVAFLLFYIVIFMSIKYKNIMLVILFLIFHTSFPIFQNPRLTMLDVGQGDSMLLQIHGTNILIDTGGIKNKEIGKAVLLPSLKARGITKLHYLILTHGDFDHMGEAVHLVENFKVEKVIFNCGPYNDLESKLMKLLDEKKIKYYSCIKEIKIGKYKLQFLNTRKYNNENDNSHIIYFHYHHYKFLFMGDAGVKKEKDILDQYHLGNIDFLKVGHHGSNTSSSKYFIDNIKPKYAFISVGKNNRYGHPKKSVLNTLSSSKIFRTDLDGSIAITLSKNQYKIGTCLHRKEE